MLLSFTRSLCIKTTYPIPSLFRFPLSGLSCSTLPSIWLPHWNLFTFRTPVSAFQFYHHSSHLFLGSNGLEDTHKEGKKKNPFSPPVPHIRSLDIRIGRILNVKHHPAADILFIEEIDVGEEKPRQIVSGLVPFYSEQSLLNRLVLVVCNLAPKELRGVLSEGMVLAASIENPQGQTQVELVQVPPSCSPGENLQWDGISRFYA